MSILRENDFQEWKEGKYDARWLKGTHNLPKFDTFKGKGKLTTIAGSSHHT